MVVAFHLERLRWWCFEYSVTVLQPNLMLADWLLGLFDHILLGPLMKQPLPIESQRCCRLFLFFRNESFCFILNIIVELCWFKCIAFIHRNLFYFFTLFVVPNLSFFYRILKNIGSHWLLLYAHKATETCPPENRKESSTALL